MIEVGNRIKMARALLRWTQKQLALQCGLKTWVISAIERGELRPSHAQQVQIGHVLVAATGADIRNFFPSFIPIDGDDLPCEGINSDQAGTLDRCDER